LRRHLRNQLRIYLTQHKKHTRTQSIADLERYAILQTLEACGGSTSKAALVLGISPRKIQYKLHEYSGGPPPVSRS
jgi:DNA-binding NtrC family response regulator